MQPCSAVGFLRRQVRSDTGPVGEQIRAAEGKDGDVDDPRARHLRDEHHVGNHDHAEHPWNGGPFGGKGGKSHGETHGHPRNPLLQDGREVGKQNGNPKGNGYVEIGRKFRVIARTERPENQVEIGLGPGECDGDDDRTNQNG